MRGPNAGFRKPRPPISRTTRCRCPRHGSSSSSIPSSSTGPPVSDQPTRRWQVVVADARRVRVAVGPLHRLGSRPHPDARDRLQPAATTPAAAERQRPLQRRRDRTARMTVAERPARAGAVPLPARDPRPLVGRGRHDHARRGRPGRRRRRARRSSYRHAPHACAGHLLLQDRRHEHRDHVFGGTAGARAAGAGVGQERVVRRRRTRPVVAVAEQLGRALDRPLGAVAPRRDPDGVARLADQPPSRGGRASARRARRPTPPPGRRGRRSRAAGAAALRRRPRGPAGR